VNPNVTGDEAGSYSGKAYYLGRDLGWLIWWNGPTSAWTISGALGERLQPVPGFFERSDPIVTGAYTAAPDAWGTPTVSTE